MARRPGNPHIWRTFRGRRWKLADFLHATAEEVRNAEKPADLTFAISRTLDLTHQIREYQYEWLEKAMKLESKDRGRWPHL